MGITQDGLLGGQAMTLDQQYAAGVQAMDTSGRWLQGAQSPALANLQNMGTQPTYTTMPLSDGYVIPPGSTFMVNVNGGLLSFQNPNSYPIAISVLWTSRVGFTVTVVVDDPEVVAGGLVEVATEYAEAPPAPDKIRRILLED